MATFNYYLRNANAVSKTPIVLYISINSRVTKLSTGESIEPIYWDVKKQRAKKSLVGSPELNEFLNGFLLRSQSTFRNFKAESTVPNRFQIRKAIELPGTKAGSELREHFTSYLEATVNTKEPNTLKKFKGLFNHLVRFQNLKHDYYTFESINAKFHDDFVNYLQKNANHNNNTVSKYVRVLKTYMQWCFDRELHNNMAFKRFKAREYAVEVIYLTAKELFKIHELDLSQKPTLNKVRDAFCFGCFTGQRFSDISDITWDDIKGDTWILHTKKTKENIEVPLNCFSKAILKKNKNQSSPLQVFTNQKMNQYLKDIAVLAELNETIRQVGYSGNNKLETRKPKHKLITTHIARKTFVTLSLENGMRPETVMEITGHKDFKTLRRYIKITSKVKGSEMQRVWSTSNLSI
jgi:integrase